MPKIVKVILILLLFLSLSFSYVFASGFQINQIGSMDITGSQSSEWWYSGVNPSFGGKAPAGSTVTVAIDGIEQNITAGDDGVWWFNPQNLNEGDHNVTLSSDAGSNIAFMLHIGPNIPSNIGTSSAPDTPVAGVSLPTYLLVFIGLALLSSGIYLFRLKTQQI
jgi:hypothetical protein